MASKQAERRKAAKQRDREAMTFRSLSVRAETIDAETRSVRTVISTETPIPMMDWDRWEMVPEVLRADGAILPAQVPFLDNHQRYSVNDQIGSVREIEKSDREIVGRLHFASAAQREWDMVREGHVTDVSAGYQVIERTYIPKGQKQTVGGREYSGPVSVVTKWRLREVSLTPIGADEQAKLRGFDAFPSPEPEGFTMNEQLRSLLESRGMPKGLSDDAAQVWAVDNNFGERAEEKPKADPEPKPAEITPDFVMRTAQEAAKLAIAEATRKQQELRARTDQLLKIAGIINPTAELREKLDTCRSIEDAEKTIIEYRANAAQGGVPLTSAPIPAGQQLDKFRDAMSTSLILRCMDGVSMPNELDADKRRELAREKVFPAEKRAKDAEQFRHVGLYDMARTWVEKAHGIDTFGLSREQVATIAMFGPERAQKILGFRVREAAYHTTGNFSELTRDAMNKSMMLGYTEYPSTWEFVMRRGASVPDFKQINRMRIGAIPNLPAWNDNKDPEKVSLTDARESYRVETYSAQISFSHRLLINDDMDSLSRVPGMMGAAARRTVNATAWSVITSNPTMSDGVALFSAATGNRKRSNLTTGAGAPSVSTLQTLSNLMMQMRGENTPEGNEGPDILGLTPRYIVGPSALSTTIRQLVLSAYDPANANMAYNTAAELIPVIEPLLDANSTTAWYLFADKSQIDTGEVTFLQGYETPVVRMDEDFKTLSQEWIILQTFGAKAMNHRGIQRHNNA